VKNESEEYVAVEESLVGDHTSNGMVENTIKNRFKGNFGP
jgi:hypothetical protein